MSEAGGAVKEALSSVYAYIAPRAGTSTAQYIPAPSSDPPGPAPHVLYTIDESDGEDDYDTDSDGAGPIRRRSIWTWLANVDWPVVVLALVGINVVAVYFYLYPFPTTIPVFIGLAVFVTGWVVLHWFRLGWSVAGRLRTRSFRADDLVSLKNVGLALATALLIWWAVLGLKVPDPVAPTLATHTPDGRPEKYFIAANLYWFEDGLPAWTEQLKLLIDHLGRDRCFVSIHESNSWDGTKDALHRFGDELGAMGVGNRIVTENDDGRHWNYGTDPERIAYLAGVRNKALLPLQAEDEAVRIADYDTYTRLMFFNDIIFRWEDMAVLLATDTGGEYDQLCAMDYGYSGLYDTWVARDECGIPLRPFWPHVKDAKEKALVVKEEPFPVTACWNGVTVFRAEPFLYRPSQQVSAVSLPGTSPNDLTLHSSELVRRGWKAVDDPSVPDHRMSPNLTLPLRFRDSGIDACDHSECFLISYDLHRLYNARDYPDRPPRIWMNPQVRVAYEQRWWTWNNVVTRRPIVRWWINHWSHSYPLLFVDWIWEYFARQRDYCTWSALRLKEDCPALPGAPWRHWWE